MKSSVESAFALNGAAPTALLSPYMIEWLRKVVGRLAKLFQPQQPEADRSRLVGMYLNETNKPGCVGIWSSGNQQRQDGKFARNRQRA